MIVHNVSRRFTPQIGTVSRETWEKRSLTVLMGKWLFTALLFCCAIRKNAPFCHITTHQKGERQRTHTFSNLSSYTEYRRIKSFKIYVLLLKYKYKINNYNYDRACLLFYPVLSLFYNKSP